MPARWLIALSLLGIPAAKAAVPTPAPKHAKHRINLRCDQDAKQLYRRNTTEVEMALITGNLNDVEVARAREGIQRRLHEDEQECEQQFLQPGRTRVARSKPKKEAL